MELERALVQRLVADIPIAGNSLCIAEMNRRAEALGITKPAAKSGAKRKGGPAVEEPSDSDDFETPKKEKDDQVQPKSSEKTKEKKGKKEKGDKKEKNDKKDKDKEKKEKKPRTSEVATSWNIALVGRGVLKYCIPQPILDLQQAQKEQSCKVFWPPARYLNHYRLFVSFSFVTEIFLVGAQGIRKAEALFAEWWPLWFT